MRRCSRATCEARDEGGRLAAMRHRPRLDATHQDARELLELHGWSVLSLAGLGGSAPDLLIAKAGFTALLEMKTGDEDLAPGQQRFRERWRGVYLAAWSAAEALAVAEEARKRYGARAGLTYCAQGCGATMVVEAGEAPVCRRCRAAIREEMEQT